MGIAPLREVPRKTGENPGTRVDPRPARSTLG
ncbi:hypothetical protein [Streptomyces sp. NPDC057381]